MAYSAFCGVSSRAQTSWHGCSGFSRGGGLAVALLVGERIWGKKGERGEEWEGGEGSREGRRKRGKERGSGPSETPYPVVSSCLIPNVSRIVSLGTWSPGISSGWNRSSCIPPFLTINKPPFCKPSPFKLLGIFCLFAYQKMSWRERERMVLWTKMKVRVWNY